MNEQISSFLAERIAANDFPSAVYLIAEKGDIVFQDAIGLAVVEPEQVEARPDTIYDLASLTKPLVTGLLTAQRIENGEIDLETRIGDQHTVFARSAVATLNIRELATHTSGLPAWRPFYLLADSPTAENIGKIIANNDIAKRGVEVEYSDLNFIALAMVNTNGSPENEFETRAVKELGLTRTSFNPLQKGFNRSEIAASEKGNVFERQTCIEQGYIQSSADKNGSGVFRNDQIWGEVHDGNAYFMGGVAGHAGLFSTAEEAFKIALQFLPNHTQLMKPATCELFRTNFTEGLNEDRSFGFQLASTEGSTAGTKMPPESFGHTGFTGTSLWIDPINERIFILLTNRTHYHGLPFTNINSVRRRFHDLAIGALDVR